MRDDLAGVYLTIESKEKKEAIIRASNLLKDAQATLAAHFTDREKG